MNVPTSTSRTVRTFGAIAATFERVCGDVKFDAALAKRLISFQIGFVNKNEDHIAFFGGVLTGVHIVRFVSTDMNTFFSEVLQINEIELEDELHALPAIVADRKVSGDVFNHTCLWLVHKFLNSNLPPEVAKRAALAAALVLQYRYLTSLLSWYYKHPANPEDAQAAYSRLTKKSAIKQHGSWHALLEVRCADFFPPDGLHRNTVMQYKDDEAIGKALNDSQGRIRSMMKHLMHELLATKAAGARVRSVATTVEHGGEDFLRDNTNNLSTYVQYIYRVLPDEHTFIKQEILDILAEALPTAPPAQVREALLWMSKNFKTTQGKIIDGFIEETMVHSFNYLAENRTVARKNNDLAAMILRLKGIYMSSRSTEPKLMKIRDDAVIITRSAIKTRNESVIAAVKTALMLYIVTRAFTMSFYSRG